MSNSDLELRRVEMTDGFVMQGFRGRYFMWPEEYWLLSKYLDMTSGDYLEIGSMCGIIAMSFAEKYSHRRFVCVDKFIAGHGTIAGERETFLQNLREHNLKNVTLEEGDSLAVVPKLVQKFEIVFIDANHAYDYVLGDASNSWPLLLPGGFMAFHDYGYVEETTRAVEEFLRKTGGRFLESASSLAVVQKQPIPMRGGLRKHMESEYGRLLHENNALQQQVEKLQADADWLLDSIKTHEEESARLAAEKRELETILGQVQNSAGWRALSKWRRVRSLLAPENTSRRRLYDSVLRNLGGKS